MSKNVEGVCLLTSDFAHMNLKYLELVLRFDFGLVISPHVNVKYVGR